MTDIKKKAPRLEADELAHVFEEYKSRIDDVVQKEQKKRLEAAEQESRDIVSNAWRKAQSMLSEAQEKSQQLLNEASQQSKDEADRIVLEAQNRAQQIVKEADDRAKNEAKEKTRREVEKILAGSKKEADKQSTEILARSRKEAQDIASEAGQIARAQAQKESLAIIAEARELARKIDDNAVARIADVNRLLADIMQKAESLLDKFRAEVQQELVTSLSAITKVKYNLESGSDNEEIASAAKAGSKVSEPQPLQGRRELQIIPPCDDLQIKRLVEFLEHLPNIRLAGQASNGDIVTIYVDIMEALPLLNILKESPLVLNSYVERDAIMLRLKTRRN